ncbi:multidrug resistance-associated protein 4 [Scaptodrosophila lebanonensis]|uniref:Multidrug resistance-associated protein 4 n=1 Tax=Drosophila lebanonensis TaxID=7225 RepID=A0A6J2TJW0_DROLE|nr:multidrug resistance-associated protein 4 [Scaptodrosophila lebanonensis]
MDSSAKPERKNPRHRANIFSQLIFAWTVPLMYKGSRKGLNTDDLTKCLAEDESEPLGDRLEDKWYQELENARRKSRKPRLRNALFNCFLGPTIVNGLICLIYIVLKSLIPAVLAQLLLQFQRATPATEVRSTEGHELVDALNRTARAIGGVQRDYSQAPDADNKDNPVSENALETGEPFKEHVYLDAEAGNATTALAADSFKQMVLYLWNDTYSLGAILVLSTVLGCFLLHHVDLRQRLMGAKMRIACCSLIYRKTLRLSMKTAGQTPAGYLINLLSNDVNRLDYGFIFMHWIWIMPLHAVLICYLIWLRIGIPALVGVVGLLLKTVPVQTALSKLASVLRLRTALRTDARVGIMNELVQGIQVIKMYAWERPFQAVVAEARRSEVQQIRYASYLRGFYLSTMVFTERSTLYITVAAAALLGNTISADFVFSAASYYNILQLVAAIWYPLAVSFGAEALVSLQRIQDYLLMEGRDEKVHGITQKHDEGGDSRAIVFKNIDANWDAVKPQRTLQDINLEIQRGQLCAVIGPVGAGKSSLLQLLLGELPIIDGSVVIQGELSYAAQEPWLFTGTVRNNILFGEKYDRKRYHEVTRCCALSTDFQQLSNGDKTVVGERGTSLSGGQRARISLARAVYKPASIYLLDDPLSAVDAHVGRHLFDEVIGPRGRLAQEKATRLLVTHQVHFLSEADWIVIVDQGRILRQGTYEELLQSDLDFAKLLERPALEENDGEKQQSGSSATLNGLTVDDEDDIPYIDGVRDGYQPLRKQSISTHGSKSLSGSSDQADGDDEVGLAEAQAAGGVSGRVWYEYFHAGSTFFSFSFMVFIMLLSQVVCSSSDYFANIWTQQEYQRSQGQPTLFTTYECMYIYGALIIGVVIMTVFRGFLFFKTCMHASKVLHDRMFACILHATMRFFDTNPSGRILNRFSKDMGAIDELLPRAMMDFIQIALVMFGILIVITVVNPVLVAAMLVVAVIDMLVLKLYLRPSQDLKRLEGICRSPVFSHLSSSLSGLAIIRSRGLQDVVAKEFDNLQDVHSGVWQVMMATNTALGLWLDCVSCVFLTSVTFSFIISSEATYSGNVGLAISQAMVLTGMVQYGVRQVAESLQQMTSVERVLQYTELEQEPVVEKEPASNWPTLGQIEFRDMSCRYDPNGSPVLKHLNLLIEPGWKVGIVGRTGAGKSSLIGALFRLAYIEGGIYIDGIETGTISLETLRTRISIIPQDPVLFSATIRYNLDPFERYSDVDLWSALEYVELRSAIPGLDFMVTERGSNFSVGQRQLLCLARAILRNNKVLVLDEATANVDPQTDALIQRTIRVRFQHCTVLTVAHRLHTVMDSDRIVVMDAGTAVEFDVPHLLLKKQHGVLRQMVEATGGEAEALKKTAAETFQRLQRQREQHRQEYSCAGSSSTICGQLCAVIGPVGAGKSSLLQLLLGELPITDGSVVIQGELSYAAQEPWLFTGTVRNNILFGEKYDRKRYHEVTRCCALSTDFQQLSNGDKTVVGERGTSLSGGQRARISLARAVYKPASIYLLDDPLSAVDAHVGRHLFDEVIGPRGRLAQEKATRLLVTHQVHFLSEADWIVIVDQGRILRQGTYEELLQSDLDFAKLLERPALEENDGEKQQSGSSATLNGLTVDDEDDIPYIDGVRDGYQPLRKQSISTHGSKSLSGSSDQADGDDEVGLAEAQAAGGVSGRVWYEYFHAGSTFFSFSFMVFIMLLSQVVCSSSDYFANIWTQQEYQRSQGQPTLFTTYECMYIYGALIIGVVIMTVFRGFLFFKTCMHASKVLHDRMFACILHATMRFFDTNPSGRILNRFSKDMGAIDELLPRAMMDFIQIALVMFGILIVITVVNPVLVAAMLVVAVIDMLVLKLYLRPSQDLKRLEGICRSPVFSHLSSSLSGLAIIRSRGLQDVVAKEFDNLQDVHSGVWQVMMATNTALGLWLDCVSCVFLTSVTFSFIISSEATYSGNVGLAISQAMILTGMVQYGVRQVAESLQQMTSVERVLQYTELEQEPVVEKEPASNWPTLGQIEFRDMSCRYDPNGSPVLKHLNLLIEPGWKVGIVGRTGAGKSSLIGALFRLAYIEGGIYIDGIETGTISLETLRTRISIIPQDPVLFSATIRYNLDPFERYSDVDLWSALEYVELCSAIPGLDFMVTERGSNFSVGQRQLLCLARAILRNNKVLVLDEATANVDPQTDALIQRTIRVRFQHCTVLTVAHRLHTVMDSDRIVVMDAGTAVEFDVPHLLLKKQHGVLRQMVEATGGEAEALKKTAAETFQRLQRQREQHRQE